MGREIDCGAQVDGARVAGRALLETDEIVFRSKTARVRVPFRSIALLETAGEELVIQHGEAVLRLSLGKAEATRWLEAIRNPKGRIDKLGVKAGLRVAVLGVVDESFSAELRERGVELAAKPPFDVVFFAANTKRELAKLETVKTRIVDAGAIWIIRPKGIDAITERDVMTAAKEAGLVDVKVVRFSDTHTAEKVVIPVASRGVKPPAKASKKKA